MIFFAGKPKKSFQIHLDLQGSFIQKETIINTAHGSAYDLWIKMGKVEASHISKETLSALSIPFEISREMNLTGDGYPTYELEPLEVRI